MSDTLKSANHGKYTDPAVILQLLNETKTVAVVGLSTKTARPSHGVALYMKNEGFKIIPVSPNASEILGEKAYPDLKSAAAEHDIDMVDVFRRPEDCPPIAREAVEIGAKSIWFQLGVINEEAATIAENGGLSVVMDRCLKVEHRRYADRMDVDR
ncbi:MAG: CoA-binding protein [Chloroflexota bacterium]